MTRSATWFDLQVNGYAGVDFNQDREGFLKGVVAFTGWQMRRDESRLARSPRREGASNDPGPQFQRTQALAAAPRRAIQMPIDFHRPSHCQIRFGRHQDFAIKRPADFNGR